jgi:tetratricopeptide (TPR) repeat protein
MTFKLADAMNRKSQIAIEYCYRWHNQYPQGHVFWIHASTPQKIDQAYHDIGRKLTIPGWNDPAVNSLKLVSEWLSNDEHGSWLLVLDNSDDMETFFGAKSDLSSAGSEQTGPIVNYIPRSSNGSIIITTRDKRVGERLANREKPIEILPMDRPEAESLLWSKVPPDYILDRVRSSELLELLGYLPLAITQAAAYISENSISVEDYVKAFQAADSEMQDLLSVDLPDHRRDFEMRSDMQNSVIRTWKVSFDQIRNQKPRAAEILSLMAVLDRQGIPKMLIRRDGERGTEFTTALGVLQAFSLVGAEKGGESFKMHRLVQISTQRWLRLHGEMDKWRVEALQVLSELFPPDNYENWAACEALTPHVQVVTQYTFTPDLNLQYAKLLHKASSYDETQGRYNVAYGRCLDALSIRKNELGPEHRDTLRTICDLGVLLERQGKYDVAKEMHQQVLELSQKVLGPEHLDTLVCMYNLASVLLSQGKYQAAEDMQQQVLELSQKLRGPEHPDTLNSMYYLADVLLSQGKYEAAEDMQQKVLKLSQKLRGPEHPDTLKSMHNLGKVLERQGKYEAAKEMHQRELELCKKLLGPQHPDTLISMDGLAIVLLEQGKYEAAVEIENQVLEQRQKVLGPEHPYTISTISGLGWLLRCQGKYTEAEELLRQALEAGERVLGPDHPETLTTAHNLASTLVCLKKYDEASILYQRAYLGYQKRLGSDHPFTKISLKCYSDHLERMKQN